MQSFLPSSPATQTKPSRSLSPGPGLHRFSEPVVEPAPLDARGYFFPFCSRTWFAVKSAKDSPL